jgi:membrane-bound serine protease (ClpP class)
VTIDTFGGRVDSAIKIRDMLVDCPTETVAYISPRAWSAGALIALSNEHMIMASGSSIGAAEPIPTTEKTVAAVKAEFSATATRMGRNPKVAEAMVDKSLGFPDYAEKGQILALTDRQAETLGFSQGTVSTLDGLIAEFGAADAVRIDVHQDWRDMAAGWLGNPYIQVLLVSLIFLAIMTEVKTAGFGGGGIVALFAGCLLIAGNWLIGFDAMWAALMFVGGLFLIGMELFVPGFGIFGIIGVLMLLGSLFYLLGASEQAVYVIAGAMIAASILFYFLARYLPESRVWKKLSLTQQSTKEGGYVSSSNYQQYLHGRGITETILRPSGTILLGGVRLNVVANGTYVRRGVLVEIIQVEGSRIVVEPVISE